MKCMYRFSGVALALSSFLALGACAQLGVGQPDGAAVTGAQGAAATDAQTNGGGDVDPVAPSAPPPPPAANTQATLDTTTAEQRRQAAAPPAAARGARILGTTVASLGSPTEPGFWLKTPLVQAEAMGRVTNKGNGKSSAVKLIPIEGPASGGSRLSLPAMRLIDASLTELIEIEVTLGG